ncbi:MAG: hypothetical protein QOC93_1977 [Actinomycetota bacterium]|jgi:hypothetical protein|nr:hypothetical protein [Actinomycetota bacterium]
MIRLETLMAALAVSAPTLWGAFVVGDTTVDTALVRFLLAVPVCAVGLMLLRKVFQAYSGPSATVVAAEQALHDTRASFARRRADAPDAA